MNSMPLKETALWDMLNASEARMNPEIARFWEAIRVPPEKWQQIPYGEPSGGFWVVAILGSLVVWYNDIEAGFNYSHYSTFGKIGKYWCNQDELELVLQGLLHYLQTGQLAHGRAGPPVAGVFLNTT